MRSKRSSTAAGPKRRLLNGPITRELLADDRWSMFRYPSARQCAAVLHGFPDSGRLWRHQVGALAEAGLRVIVPDMRGYGRSDKPSEVQAYTIEQLVGDVLAVIGASGAERAHVVGHDWGAGVAWALASVAPQSVDHPVALSVGHPATFFAEGYEQNEKSWYMLLFQF